MYTDFLYDRMVYTVIAAEKKKTIEKEQDGEKESK